MFFFSKFQQDQPRFHRVAERGDAGEGGQAQGHQAGRDRPVSWRKEKNDKVTKSRLPKSKSEFL